VALAGRRKTWSEFKTGFTRSDGRYGRLEQSSGLEDAARLLSLYGGFIDEVYGIREMSEQSRRKPVDPEVLVRLAEAHIARKSASLVLRIFLTVSNPFTLIPFGLIQAYKRGRNIPDTEIALARRVIAALDAPATKGEFLTVRGGRRAFLKARALLILGYHERAIRLLKYALLTLADKIPVYFYLASAIAAKGDAETALAWYIAGTEAGSAQCAAVLDNLVREYRRENPDFTLSSELMQKMEQLLAVPEKKTDWQKVLSGFINTKVEALDNLVLRLERTLEGWLAK
jgi:tetratricopeptide (TPR) repeat protein